MMSIHTFTEIYQKDSFLQHLVLFKTIPMGLIYGIFQHLSKRVKGTGTLKNLSDKHKEII